MSIPEFIEIPQGVDYGWLRRCRGGMTERKGLRNESSSFGFPPQQKQYMYITKGIQLIGTLDKFE